MIAIAIDPGTTGAVALVRDGVMLGWGAWRRSGVAYQYHASTIARANPVTCLPAAVRAAVVHLPGEGAATCAALEEIKPHGAKRGYTLLAEAAGIARCVLYEAVEDPLRCPPSDWRPAVLGIPGNADAAAAERYAVGAWGWTEVRRRKPLPLGELRAECREPPAWAVGHVAEAGCMAVWALHHGAP